MIISIILYCNIEIIFIKSQMFSVSLSYQTFSEDAELWLMLSLCSWRAWMATAGFCCSSNLIRVWWARRTCTDPSWCPPCWSLPSAPCTRPWDRSTAPFCCRSAQTHRTRFTWMWFCSWVCNACCRVCILQDDKWSQSFDSKLQSLLTDLEVGLGSVLRHSHPKDSG